MTFVGGVATGFLLAALLWWLGRRLWLAWVESQDENFWGFR